MLTNIRKVPIVLLFSVLFALTMVNASDRRFAVYGGALYGSPQGGEKTFLDQNSIDDCGTDCIDIVRFDGRGTADSYGGMFLGASYRISDRVLISLELSGTQTIEIEGPLIASIREFDPTSGNLISEDRVEIPPDQLDVGAELDGMTRLAFFTGFDLTANSSIDVLLGPVVSWVSFGDASVIVDRPSTPPSSGNLGSVDSQFAAGVKLQFDAPFLERWFFTGALTYLDLSTNIPAVSQDPDQMLVPAASS